MRTFYASCTLGDANTQVFQIWVYRFDSHHDALGAGTFGVPD